jgi:starch synthase
MAKKQKESKNSTAKGPSKIDPRTDPIGETATEPTASSGAEAAAAQPIAPLPSADAAAEALPTAGLRKDPVTKIPDEAPARTAPAATRAPSSKALPERTGKTLPGSGHTGAARPMPTPTATATSIAGEAIATQALSSITDAGTEDVKPTVSAPAPDAITEPSPAGENATATVPAAEPNERPAHEAPPESDCRPEPEPEPPPGHWNHRPSLFIVHITPEMAPVAKVGGLADVVFGIAREHAIRGNQVEIILPKYDNLRYDHIYELHEVYRDLWVPWYEGAIHCTVFFGFVHGRKCFFIEPHSQDNFFNRGSIYGFKDDVLRFAFFSRAAIEFLWKSGKHPDVVHCHDWQTALVPVFLYEIYQQLGMTHPRVCLTIHNFQHQGHTGAELLRATGLHRPERFFDRLRMGDNHHKGALNLLKAGIVYSNFVTTVSPRYAFETKDQGQGFGLEPTLHTHHMKYGGVLNGIDYDVWNPEVDRYIPVRYGVDNLDAKYDNKRALRHRLMLADNEKPIVAFIGRLDPQKGLELVRHGIFYALEHGAQFVLLGSSPDQAINNDFWGLKRMLNDSPDCHLEIGFDEDLSHLIYAGADIMLVPSQFEPCGLTQLISLRYGTVPVVRTVGGLADTVFDKDHSDRSLDLRNGYRFDNYDGPGLESALGRAIDCYYQYPEHFRELIKNGMRADYSWNHPGQDYMNIYELIRAR